MLDKAAQSLTSATVDAEHAEPSAQSATSSTVAAADIQPNILEKLIEISKKQNVIMEYQICIKDDLKAIKAHFVNNKQ